MTCLLKGLHASYIVAIFMLGSTDFISPGSKHRISRPLSVDYKPFFYLFVYKDGLAVFVHLYLLLPIAEVALPLS